MRKNSRHILIVLLAILIISCKNRKEISITDAELPTSSKTSGSLKKITQLDTLINEISKLERLEGKYLSYDGHPSTQKDYSQELLKLADTSSLVRLTNHKNPIVRYLSFKTLDVKGYPKIINILKAHIRDNETYQLFAGCLITPEPVNLSMYNCIKDRLTKNEKQIISRQLKEQLAASKYWAINFLNASI